MGRRPVAAPLAVALVAAAVVAGPSAAPAASQDACVGTGRAADLPPGEHVIHLSSTLTASGQVGPVGGFELSVVYDGEVHLAVGADGRVQDGSGTVAVTFDGAITGIPGIGGDLAGSGSGELSLVGASGTEVRLGGELGGLGQLDFSGNFNDSFAAGDTEAETLTLRVTRASCQQVSGEATSAMLESSRAQLAASGLTAAQTPMVWEAGGEASPEVQEIHDELAAIEQLGTAGPERRFATSRLSKAFGRIKALPEDQQTCLFEAWQETARTVLQRRIDSDIAVISAMEPTSADQAPLRGAVASLIESEKQYQLLGFDRCSEGDRRPAFETIADAVNRFLARAVEDGHVVDAIRLMRDFRFFGDISPALAEQADAMIGAALRDLVRTTVTNLERLAREAKAAGDRDCSLSDGHTVRKAVAAVRNLALWGDDAPPYDEVVAHAEVLGCAP